MQTNRAAGAILIALFFGLAGSPAGAQRSRPTAPPASVLFAQNCAACHGSDGRGGERAPNIATRQDVVSMPDARLRAIISDGIPSAGMPAFSVLGEKQVDSILAELRVLQGMTVGAQARLPGDSKAGETLFFAAGSCAQCHAVKGRGGYMASDLSAFARGRSADYVENAIVHPPEGPLDKMVTVKTDSGLKFTGLVRAKNNFTLVLQSEDGAFHSVSQDAIRSQTLSSHSYMPDYRNLSKEQLDNLASYLLQTAASPAAPRVLPAKEVSR